MKRLTKAAMAVAAVTSLAGCASMMYTPPTAEEAMQVIRAGFAERGVAKLDRIQQTELQAACSKYPKGDLPKELRVRLEKSAEDQTTGKKDHGNTLPGQLFTDPHGSLNIDLG